jgi:hypothetical protein
VSWGPNGRVTDRWDPTKFDENWNFVRDTQELIKRNGKALTAGAYRVAVTDASAKANFHLIGREVDKSTGLRLRGSATWAVTLSPGVYRFGSDSLPAKARKMLTVLAAG